MIINLINCVQIYTINEKERSEQSLSSLVVVQHWKPGDGGCVEQGPLTSSGLVPSLTYTRGQSMNLPDMVNSNNTTNGVDTPVGLVL